MTTAIQPAGSNPLAAVVDTLKAQLRQALAEKKTAIAQAKAIALSLTVTTPEQSAYANELLKATKRECAALEEQRTSVTGPVHAALRSFNDCFKPLTSECDEIEENLKGKLGPYELRKRELEGEAMRAAAQAHLAGQHVQAQQALALATQAAAPPPQGTSVRAVWKARIVAPHAVPREWCVPNEQAINAHARGTPSNVAPAPIAGVEFYQEAQVTTRVG